MTKTNPITAPAPTTGTLYWFSEPGDEGHLKGTAAKPKRVTAEGTRGYGHCVRTMYRDGLR